MAEEKDEGGGRVGLLGLGRGWEGGRGVFALGAMRGGAMALVGRGGGDRDREDICRRVRAGRAMGKVE